MDDTVDIISKLNIYALGVDTQDWGLFDQVFAPDVYVDCAPGLQWPSLEAFKAGFDALHKPLDASMHVMSNHIVTLDGDKGRSLTYGNYRLMRRVDGLARDYWEGGGWYEDDWARTPAGWRIKKRLYRVVWRDGNVTAPTVHQPANTGRISLCASAKAGQLPIVQELLALRKM